MTDSSGRAGLDRGAGPEAPGRAVQGPRGSPVYNVVIGTAGHIDHGKSTLVRHLTGIDPDRLPEEKARGLTIDLGFAPCVLKNGQKVGIIDVPGHEKFVKNMVAGATGIDFVILVVAANDGVMPQTREHLHIMKLLGVSRGMIAVTKIDTVEKDLTELVIEDVKSLVAGTFLENAPLVPLSVVTRENFDRFWDILNEEVAKTPGKSVEGVFRMPIQRVFSAKGFGTVVTGVPLSGSARMGDIIEILPTGKSGRIRGLQAYKCDVTEVRAGHSSALNIADVPHTEVQRGFVAATPGFFRATHTVEGRMQYLAERAEPLKHLAAVRFHVGTAEALGRVAVLDRREIQPGESAWVQLRLESPVVVAAGDRFVVRNQSSGATLGGGVVVSSADFKLRRLKDPVLKDLERLDAARTDAHAWVEVQLARAGAKPVATLDLAHAAGLTEKDLRPHLEALVASGAVRAVSHGHRWIHREGLQRAEEQILEALRVFHEKNPIRLGPDPPALRTDSKLDADLFEMGLAGLISRKAAVSERGAVRLPAFQPVLAGSASGESGAVEKLYREGRYATPRPEEAAAKLGLEPAAVSKILTYLVESGRMVAFKDEVFLHMETVEEARALVIQLIREQGAMETNAFRDRVASTRKYVVPLLEYFDATGLTVRDGNRRVLKPAKKS